MRSIFKNSSIGVLFVVASTAMPCKAADSKKLPPIKSPLVLGDVDGETFDQMSVINIRFSDKPAWDTPPAIEDHGMFLQITLPDTLVTEPGKFFDGAPPHFPKIAIIQTTAKDAAVRIFTNKPANLMREASKTEILGNRLIMSLDHVKLEAALNVNTNTQISETTFIGPPVPTIKNSVSAESIIGSTVVRTDLAPPSLVLKKEHATNLASGVNSLDLKGKLTKVAIFSACMFLLLVVSWLAKPLLRRKKKAEKGQPSPLSFETVASMALNPRQKLMVVQIGNDRVLLGVGSDSISFLTNLSYAGIQQEAMPAPASKVLQSFGAKKFEETLVDHQSVDLFPSPQLKNIEGNDPVSLSEPVFQKSQSEPKQEHRPRNPEAATSNASSRPGSRLNIRIDDNGATKVPAKVTTRVPTKAPSKKAPEEKKQAIDDITSIIREKLNTLRAI